MTTQLEKDFTRLVVRFAYDVVRLVRRAPLEEVHALLRLFGQKPEKPASSWQDKYGLTPSEASILKAAVEGLSRSQIAFTHGIALVTVKTHAHAILRKTGDASLLAAAARLMREGERV